MSMLGGYDPQAGRHAHEADKPTLIPVPSLLRSLLSDHLDPGYAAPATCHVHACHDVLRFAPPGFASAAAA